jgi:hypothetical protein
MVKQIYRSPKWMLLYLFLLLSVSTMAQDRLSIYGYFSTRFEKQFETKSSSETIAEASPSEWTYPFFNIMLLHQLNDNFRAFINLNGSNASNLDIRNFWGEYSFSNSFKIRLGKIYRKFGLYNEILDAVPTYYGIEPPELFDGDHLMISRTTTLMVFGSLSLSSGSFNYSLTTDNGEGGSVKNTFPLGVDLNYKFDGGNYTIGTSAYISGGNAVPDVDLGSGSPKSGVLPWMTVDHFNVLGGYVELNFSNFLFQAEYWLSEHSAERNPGSILILVQNAGLNPYQLSRFLNSPAKDINSLTNSDVIKFINYTIKTWYFRAGYSFNTGLGEIAPYLQWDWYSNPETIDNKTYGGDAEAGAADDGVFNKSTVGIVFRPIPEVAVKFDQSFHFYRSNDQNVYYPEVRFDVSYIFGN